jgi:hypothetical protein
MVWLSTRGLVHEHGAIVPEKNSARQIYFSPAGWIKTALNLRLRHYLSGFGGHQDVFMFCLLLKEIFLNFFVNSSLGFSFNKN